VGGILADGLLGDYWGILLGTSLLYIPGLLLIALTSYPYLLGETFDYNTLVAGMLVLYPLGAGFIKSMVNVFGAKQYHPTLQQPMVERYYVNFYMVINIGALVGGIVIPILAQFNVAIAYTIPVCALTLGVAVFVMGSSRYVRHQPNKDALWKTLQLLFNRTAKCQPLEESKKKNGGALENNFVDGVKQLLYVAPVTALTIPFNIAYNQIATVFVIQGSAMAKAGHVIDASTMINVDPLSVLIFGSLVGSGLYPFLAKRGIHIPITHKFAIGTFLGALAILSSITVDYAIHNQYMATGESISILWTTFNYLFFGAGEIFAITSAYDATFSIAPKEHKGLASAINLFLMGGLPSFICIALYNSCAQWFPSGSGTGITLEDYSQGQLYLYLWVLFAICMAGTIINLLPPVKNWVERIQQQSIKNAMDDASSLAAVVTLATSTNGNVVWQEKDKDVEGQTSTEDAQSMDDVQSMQDVNLY
jgi:proton-dependent oligopeptide transporter, POT family